MPVLAQLVVDSDPEIARAGVTFRYTENGPEGLVKGKTVFVIAHRFSTIRNADKIIVMDRGRAVDTGTHEELLDRGGIYADLYRLQFQDGKTVSDRRKGLRKRVDAPDADQGPSLLQRIGQHFFRF